MIATSLMVFLPSMLLVMIPKYQPGRFSHNAYGSHVSLFQKMPNHDNSGVGTACANALPDSFGINKCPGIFSRKLLGHGEWKRRGALTGCEWQ